LRFDGAEPLEKLLARVGRMPLPPYITRSADASDAHRYQTVYARAPGAVAAPTAGLHFDAPLLDRLRAGGVDFGYVTLHVGAGTFQPLRSERVEDHAAHREWLNVGAELVAKDPRTRARRRARVCVGTTVVRAAEAALRDGEAAAICRRDADFYFSARIRSIDALVTNFICPNRHC
jgi:S-adenosylmethionine:tRNA ribosyltransferase-isomerase